MALVHKHGINDMPKYWMQDPINKEVYFIWYESLRKCYPSNKMDTLKIYKENNFTMCEEWLTLSNFVEDIKEVRGYKEWVQSISSGKKLHFIIDPFSAKPIYSKDTTLFSTKAVKRKWITKESEEE